MKDWRRYFKTYKDLAEFARSEGTWHQLDAEQVAAVYAILDNRPTAKDRLVLRDYFNDRYID